MAKRGLAIARKTEEPRQVANQLRGDGDQVFSVGETAQAISVKIRDEFAALGRDAEQFQGKLTDHAMKLGKMRDEWVGLVGLKGRNVTGPFLEYHFVELGYLRGKEGTDTRTKSVRNTWDRCMRIYKAHAGLEALK